MRINPTTNTRDKPSVRCMKRRAWKEIASWYLVANDDQAINPALQRMFAQRMSATNS